MGKLLFLSRVIKLFLLKEIILITAIFSDPLTKNLIFKKKKKEKKKRKEQKNKHVKLQSCKLKKALINDCLCVSKYLESFLIELVIIG